MGKFCAFCDYCRISSAERIFQRQAQRRKAVCRAPPSSVAEVLPPQGNNPAFPGEESRIVL